MKQKKSQWSKVIFSITAAFILCSIVTIYAFASNNNSMKNPPLVEVGEEASEPVLNEGTLNLNYTSDGSKTGGKIYTPEELLICASEMEKGIESYKQFGVSVDTDIALMMYEGHPVREILDWNPVTGITSIVTDSVGPNGFGGRHISDAVDLTVVYEEDSMVGLKVSTQEEYDMRTEERRLQVSSN